MVNTGEFNRYATITPVHAAPTSRLEHAVATVPVQGWNESAVVLHGGRKNDNGVNSHNATNGQIIFDDCFVYLPRQNIWQLQAFAENGGAPVGRYGHTLTLLDPSPEAGSAVLVLFG